MSEEIKKITAEAEAGMKKAINHLEIELTILEAVRIWLPYVNIDYVIFDYDNNDIDNHKLYLEIQFSLKNNPKFGDTVKILIES